MKASQVRLENIGKRYGDQWVVRGITLQIERGEFYTFLGPSGCGKTTLLRTIAGFAAPDEGRVYLDGEPVTHVPPWKRDVGMVFQNYALWPHLTVFENVAFGLRERGARRQEIAAKVKLALEQVDLRGTANRKPSELSGGQQQRVALARTLVIQPRVLLLDEPLSNLDAKLRAEMRLELLKLQRDLGITTIYVTHDQEEALALSTRIAVMDRGSIVQEGAPREIYEQPRSPFVAAFVGKSNLFEGSVTRVDDRAVEIETLENARVTAALARPGASGPARGARLTLNIRPEAIAVVRRDDATPSTNRLPGKVLASAYQGSLVEYEIECAGRSIKANAMNPKGKPLFHRGDEVAILFAPEDVLIIKTEPRDG